MTKTKLFAMLCLIALASISFSHRVQAASQESKPPDAVSMVPGVRWVNTTQIAVHMPIRNGQAMMGGLVLGNPGTTSISVNAVLERVNPNGTFTHIAAFNNLAVEGGLWMWERPHFVARGHWYRLTLTATVTRNGFGEVVSLSRTEFAD